jgi:hypothetical protein
MKMLFISLSLAGQISDAGCSLFSNNCEVTLIGKQIILVKTRLDGFSMCGPFAHS